MHSLPADLARLLSDVDFQPGCVVQESRRAGAARLRKVRLPGARKWAGLVGIYLPIAASGEPLKVGLGRNGRFSEGWFVKEDLYPRADTIGTVIFEAEMPDLPTARQKEAELRERLLRAGYRLPYNLEPAARRIRAELAACRDGEARA